jgi:hypothetical protein
MGISIDANKAVHYDGATNDLINSRIADNPVVQRVEGIQVYSVFRRVKLNGAKGDGNPLIYALKSANGYSINIENILAFMPEFRGVLAKVAQHCKTDYVMPIPSKSLVAAMFAKRVSRCTGGLFENSMLQKKIHKDVCNDVNLLLQSKALGRGDRRSLDVLKRELQRSMVATFEMKRIEHSLRHYFAPFKMKPSAAPLAGSVLLVDDLLSTGTSLLSAKQALALQGVKDVKFLCLFSSTGAFKRVEEAGEIGVSPADETVVVQPTDNTAVSA